MNGSPLQAYCREQPWVLEDSLAKITLKNRGARMPYKRFSPTGYTFPVIYLGALFAENEFCNSYAISQQLSTPAIRQATTIGAYEGQSQAYNSAVMASQFQLALLVLLTALPAMAQTAPIEAKQALVVIQHDGSEGDVRVNGVRILHFASDPTLGKGSLTDSLGMFSTFATNGPNVVTIEARPETGQIQATTTLIGMVATGSLDDFEKPPLFKEAIAGSGKTEKTIVLKNVPEWAFLKVQPFTGNQDDVLAAVRALHKAFVDHDAKTMQAMLKPMYNDLLAYMGEGAVGTPAEFAKQMADYARNPKVEPLLADLKVESGYGNRLFVVTGPSGKPPIQAASKELGQEGKPKWLWEIGSYWIHRPDGWFVIRQ